jgi:hypothetical protein
VTRTFRQQQHHNMSGMNSTVNITSTVTATTTMMRLRTTTMTITTRKWPNLSSSIKRAGTDSSYCSFRGRGGKGKIFGQPSSRQGLEVLRKKVRKFSLARCAISLVNAWSTKASQKLAVHWPSWAIIGRPRPRKGCKRSFSGHSGKDREVDMTPDVVSHFSSCGAGIKFPAYGLSEIFC